MIGHLALLKALLDCLRVLVQHAHNTTHLREGPKVPKKQLPFCKWPRHSCTSTAIAGGLTSGVRERLSSPGGPARTALAHSGPCRQHYTSPKIIANVCGYTIVAREEHLVCAHP